MNWAHLSAFIWLRWRLRRNQFRRAGALNFVLLILAAVGAVLLALAAFAGAFAIGRYALASADPHIVTYVWDGVILAFLFSWMAGLLAELQRTEGVPLGKFLHLPVSLWGAFLLNYVSSLLNFTLVLFVPMMAGLCLGLAIDRGAAQLALVPLVAAFVLMVTAATYQFQGWLAALMSNPRKRRTVILIATVVFVALMQLPNAVNVWQPWKGKKQQRTPAEKEQVLRRFEQVIGAVNLVVPPAWLALGAEGLNKGQPWLAGAAFFGMSALGATCLWRSYRTTVRIYTGHTSGATRRERAAAVVAAQPDHFLERRFTWLSEHATAVTLAGLRSLLRAPEAKMLLLTPIIMVLVFGSALLTGSRTFPESVRPLVPLGGMGMVLFGMISLVGNQFAFDRAGFRVFVLSPIRRRDILLGKNLSAAPLALTMGLALALIVEAVTPMRLDRFLAAVLLFVPMYLLFSLLANCLSIAAPMPVTSGSLKPANPRLVPVLLHLLFVFAMPLVVLPFLLPFGAEFVVKALWGGDRWPVAILVAIPEGALMAGLYLLVLPWQGTWLQSREKAILEVVTSKLT